MISILINFFFQFFFFRHIIKQTKINQTVRILTVLPILHLITIILIMEQTKMKKHIVHVNKYHMVK